MQAAAYTIAEAYQVWAAGAGRTCPRPPPPVTTRSLFSSFSGLLEFNSNIFLLMRRFSQSGCYVCFDFYSFP